jgi:SAM-dependent methyltransferase
MTPASNDSFLIVSLVDVLKLGNALTRFSPETVTSTSAIYRFGGVLPSDVQEAIGNAGVVERRLLDTAHFLLSSDLKLQQAVYSEFFEHIAPEYESLIDLERNLRNIGNLLAILRESIGDLSGRRILDFGCGTGLAYDSLKRSNARFVGADQSQHMREIAKCRGMDTVGLDDMSGLQSVFDGAIASYVFHLIADEAAIGVLVHSIKQGGVVVANHHKDVNIDWADRTFRRYGCDATNLRSAKSVDHGSYFAYIKR